MTESELLAYEITLETPTKVHIFTVEEALFTETGIQFIGLGPSQCPEELQDVFQFASKELTATLLDESIVESLEVAQVTGKARQR